jgi:hypothetical protein
MPVLLTCPLINNTNNYAAISDLAKRHGIPYLDMNEPNVAKKLRLDYATDFRDARHVNLWGAEKLAGFLGEYIKGLDRGVRDARAGGTQVAAEWLADYRLYYGQYGSLLPGLLPLPEDVLG